jgi:hypothetical protein
MIIFSWFNAAEAKKFGAQLAQFFIQNMLPTVSYGDKAFTQKADKVLHQMAGQVLQFKRDHPLNTYQKAQLGNSFKWVLRDAKVDPDYTDKLTKWLVVQMG